MATRSYRYRYGFRMRVVDDGTVFSTASRRRYWMKRLIGAPGTDRRERFHFLWFALVVLYAGIRIVVVTVFLRQYGVNPWVFAVVELSSSVVYGFASGRLVGAVVDRAIGTRRKWLVPTVFGFLAPDVYVIASGRGMPPTVFIVIATVVIITTVAAVRELRAKMRRVDPS
jgi:hypothetical protein